MENRIDNLINAINQYLELFSSMYTEKLSDWDYRYIRGMIDALEIATGNHYMILNYKLIQMN